VKRNEGSVSQQRKKMKFLLRRCHIQHLGWTLQPPTSSSQRPSLPSSGEMNFVVDGPQRITSTLPSPLLQTSLLRAVQTANRSSRAPGDWGASSAPSRSSRRLRRNSTSVPLTVLHALADDQQHDAVSTNKIILQGQRGQRAFTTYGAPYRAAALLDV
jgi:hypothetical protein